MSPYFTVNNDSLLSRINLLSTRNILNTDDIQEFIDYFTIKLKNDNKVSGDDFKKITKWLNRSKQGLKDYFRKNIKGDSSDFYRKVHRVTLLPQDAPEWLIRKVEDNPHYLTQEELYEIKAPLKSDHNLMTKLNHIVDYLIYYLNANPQKNLVSVTWKQVHDGMKKWEESFQISEESDELLPGEHIVVRAEDGFFWVNLTDEDSLRNEGSRMNNCIGGKCDVVSEKTSEIYSLRDSQNIPYATLEYSPKKRMFPEIKGRSNQPLSSKYSKYLTKLLDRLHETKPADKSQQEEFEFSSDFNRSGVFGFKGKHYDVKDKVIIDGKLEESSKVTQEIVKANIDKFPQIGYYLEDHETFLALTLQDAHPALPMVHKADPSFLLEKSDLLEIYPNLHEKYRNNPDIYNKASSQWSTGDYYVHTHFTAFPPEVRSNPDFWGRVIYSEADTYALEYVSSRSIVENFDNIIPDTLGELEVEGEYQVDLVDFFDGFSQRIKPDHIPFLLEKTTFPEHFNVNEVVSTFYNSDNFVPEAITHPIYVRQLILDMKMESVSRVFYNLREIPFSNKKVNTMVKKEIYPVLDNRFSTNIESVKSINMSFNVKTFSGDYLTRHIRTTRIPELLVEAMKEGKISFLDLYPVVRQFFNEKHYPDISKTLLKIESIEEIRNSPALSFFPPELATEEVIDKFADLMYRGDSIRYAEMSMVPPSILARCLQNNAKFLRRVRHYLGVVDLDLDDSSIKLVKQTLNQAGNTDLARELEIHALRSNASRNPMSILNRKLYPESILKELRDDSDIALAVVNSIKNSGRYVNTIKNLLDTFDNFKVLLNPYAIEYLGESFRSNMGEWSKLEFISNWKPVLERVMELEGVESSLIYEMNLKGKSYVPLVEFTKGYPENVEKLVIHDFSGYKDIPAHELESFDQQDLYKKAVTHNPTNIYKSWVSSKVLDIPIYQEDTETLDILYKEFKSLSEEYQQKSGRANKSPMIFSPVFKLFLKYPDFKDTLFKSFALMVKSNLVIDDSLSRTFLLDIIDEEFLDELSDYIDSYLFIKQLTSNTRKDLWDLYDKQFIKYINKQVTEGAYIPSTAIDIDLLRDFPKTQDFLEKKINDHPDIFFNKPKSAMASLYQLSKSPVIIR